MAKTEICTDGFSFVRLLHPVQSMPLRPGANDLAPLAFLVRWLRLSTNVNGP